MLCALTCCLLEQCMGMLAADAFNSAEHICLCLLLSASLLSASLEQAAARRLERSEARWGGQQHPCQ